MSATHPDFAEITETFALLDEWEDRYRYLIDLGRGLPSLPDALRTDGAKVQGCASQVWIVPELSGEGAEAVLGFQGDSDAMIVKGLIAVLHGLIAGRPVGEIAGLDVPAALSPLGLEAHLSSQRSNGLRAMVSRLKQVAADAAVSTGH